MKKLTRLIPIALLFMAVTLISCAESGSSVVTGYNTIDWTANIMAPAPGKSFLMDSMNSANGAYDDVLSVCYSASSKENSDDSAATYFTGFAIASNDRSERLIIIIRDFDLFSQTLGDTVDITGSNITATYINASGKSVFEGTISATIRYTEETAAATDADGDAVTYNQTTLDMTGSFTVGTLIIDASDSIVAMTYPFSEPSM